MSETANGRAPRIAIIGSGFSGLCLGIQLRQAGIDSFTIYEKADRLGGTWRDNHYPGAACDVPSFSYCFSFEQKTDWSRKWAPQPEILEYMEHCARKYGLLPHIRFNTEIAGARFDSGAALWRLTTTTGDEIEAEVLVSGTGQLHRPNTPHFEGAEAFRGAQFHSARWDHRVDIKGKTVAVVGNAASAVQFVPEIAKEVGRLLIFQRSANWILPRADRPFTQFEKTLFQLVPPLAWLYRWWTWFRLELFFYPVIRARPGMSRATLRYAKEHLNGVLSDPDLLRSQTPDYAIGARRILISDDYLRALNRRNVDVITSPIARLAEDSIVTQDGASRNVDVVIYATGFDTTHFLAPMWIEGADGRRLGEVWKDGAEAFLGINVSGFPNLFLMYGPNTNLGHNSILFMIECQTRYIIDCIRQMRTKQIRSIDVRPEIMTAFNRQLQRQLATTAWAKTDHSWYKTASGRITNNWAGSTIEYWWRTRHADLELYRHA